MSSTSWGDRKASILKNSSFMPVKCVACHSTKESKFTMRPSVIMCARRVECVPSGLFLGAAHRIQSSEVTAMHVLYIFYLYGSCKA